MSRDDFLKLIGVEQAGGDYVPVACLLTSGYGCAGFYNALLNAELSDTCVLINTRLVELDENHASRNRVTDFNDFIQEIVISDYGARETVAGAKDGEFGTTIPLTAIPYHQIALLYPVAHISTLMKRANKVTSKAPGGNKAHDIPSFLDFDNKSLVLKLLRTKLW